MGRRQMSQPLTRGDAAQAAGIIRAILDPDPGGRHPRLSRAGVAYLEGAAAALEAVAEWPPGEVGKAIVAAAK